VSGPDDLCAMNDGLARAADEAVESAGFGDGYRISTNSTSSHET